MIGLKSNRRVCLVCTLLAVVTAALYWPVHRYDFVEYDDPEYVFENQTVRGGLSWWGLVWAMVDTHAANWHPLTWLSHMLDCQLFGLNPGAHHLVSLLLHCANSVLLFLLLRSTTGGLWRSASVAALFAWHPLRVESVAWISERKDVLGGLFFMLTLWAYLRYVEQSKVQPPTSNFGESMPGAEGQVTRPEAARSSTLQAPRCYALTLLVFALGLLSKPMLVTVPLVLLLLDYWPLQRLQLKTQASRPTTFQSLIAEKLPFLFLAAAVGLITVWAQKTSGAVVSLESEGPVSRIENALAGLLGYLEKLFWPQDLAVLYLRPQTVPTVSLVVAVCILIGVSIFVWANRGRRPYLAVGWFWFIIMLLPVSGLVQVGLQSIADRYTYLPSIGLFLALAWGAVDLAGALCSPRARQVLLAGTTALVLMTCAYLTRRQLGYWQNTETLMERVLQVDPGNYIAHQNLGIYFSRRGRTAEARAHRQRVGELDPALSHNVTNRNHAPAKER